MQRFKIIQIAASGQPLPDDAGLPDLFAPFVIERWQQKVNCEVVAILLKEYTAAAWMDLGNILINSLLPMDHSNHYVGLCFDGDSCFLDSALTWLRSFKDSILPRAHGGGIVEIKLTVNPHPINMTNVINVTWTSFQPVNDAHWLESIWKETSSTTYNQGCDLMLTVYNNNVIVPFSEGEPLTIEKFGSTLDTAIGWIIPIDGYMGFIVGISCQRQLLDSGLI